MSTATTEARHQGGRFIGNEEPAFVAGEDVLGNRRRQPPRPAPPSPPTSTVPRTTREPCPNRKTAATAVGLAAEILFFLGGVLAFISVAIILVTLGLCCTIAGFFLWLADWIEHVVRDTAIHSRQ